MAATPTPNYEETLTDIEATIGLVPGFMAALPAEDLIHEWPVFKRYILGESDIAPKDRELVGLAVAANIKCPYCQAFHKGTAQLHGATDKELSEVAVLAGLTARWSAMIHAQNYDYDTFIEELKKISSFLQPGYQTSFTVLDHNLSAAEESARVTVEDGRVTVIGTIVGNDGCYTARLDGVTIEEGTLVVRVESFDDADEGEACTDALIGIEYEAVIEFNREPPASVRIEHNGDPVATETEYPMNPLVFDRWLHAHEEDSTGIETYRPANRSFPPARGRKGFEIHKDGRFVELAIAPDDGTLEHQGRWSNEEGRELDVRLENGTSYVLEIVDIEEGSLKVRRR